MFKKIILVIAFILLAIPSLAQANEAQVKTKETKQTEKSKRKTHLDEMKQAVKDNDIEKVKTLLDETQPDLVRFSDYVCRYGSVQALELLFQKGLKIDSKDEGGYTLLHHAVFYNNIEIVQYLIEHKQDVNAVSNEDRSVFILLSNSSIEMAQLFENTSLVVSDTDKQEIVNACLDKDKLPLAKYFIQKGYPFTIDDYKEGERVAKHLEYGHLDVISYLVDNGLALEANYRWNYWNNTMLCYANAFDKKEIQKYLLDKGANIHVRCDINGDERYVDKAVKNADLELYKILVKKGFDPKSKGEGSFDQYPFSIAIKYNNVDLVKEMINSGVDINVQVNRMSPLTYAASKGFLTSVKLLVEKGADPSAFDEQHNQAIDYAQAFGHEETVKYLLPFDKTETFLKRYKQKKTSDEEDVNYGSKILRSNNQDHIKQISKNKHFHELARTLLSDRLENGYSAQEIQKALDIILLYKVKIENKNAYLRHPNDFAVFKVLADSLADEAFIAKDETYFLLLDLVRDNKLKELQYLVDKGASLKYVENNHQDRLLITAVLYADAQMVSYLLEQKEIDILAEDSRGQLPIEIALRARALDKIKALMQKPTGKESYELVPSAFQTGDDEIIQYFMQKYEVDALFAKRTELLIHATAGRNTKSIELILGLGLDINEHSTGYTALAFAVKYRLVDMVKYLLENGADTSLETNGDLLYIYSRWIDDRREKQEEELEIIKLLLEHNVPTANFLDDNSNTTLSLYIQAKEGDFVQVLIEGGAKIYESDIGVAMYNDLEKELIINMINAFDEKDITNTSNPLFQAIEHKDKDLIKLLIDKGFSLYENLDCTYNAAPIYMIGMSNDIESTQYALKNIHCLDTEQGWIKSLAHDAKRDGYTQIEELANKRYKELQECTH